MNQTDPADPNFEADPPPEETPFTTTEASEPGELAFSARLLLAFGTHIEPPRTSLFYQFSLLLVTLFMVLLPVIYLLMIAAAGWSVWWYATHMDGVLKPMAGATRLYFLQLVIYFGPLFVGSIATLFMFKPLFARRVEHIQPLAINPGAEPILYAFISRICELVRSPMPAEIALASNVNASARFRRGFFSRDLTLTIGLPLAAGLTTQELAAVVAHELGHFNQGLGMRLTYIINRVNTWLVRVVYERDSWDVWLDELMEGSESFLWTFVVILTHIAVGFSRLILRLLMLLGHLVSSFALRQMEYNADQFEMQVAGSEAFERTMLRLQMLGMAEGIARDYLQKSWEKKGRLPDDMVAFIVRTDANLDAEVRSGIEGRLGLETTRWYHSHPSLADRIRQARRLGVPGIFHLDWPATSLFQNFEVLSRQVTMVHYRDEIGLPIVESNLYPTHHPPTAEAKPAEAPPSSPDATPSATPGERPRIRLRTRTSEAPTATPPPPASDGGVSES